VLSLACAATVGAAQEIRLAHDVANLPAPVQRMRLAILQAAKSGEIEQLRLPIEMNELRPIFGRGESREAIEFLKSISGDGNGREMLAVLLIS